MSQTTRRNYLRSTAVAAGLASGVAGCVGSETDWERAIGLATPLTGALGALGEKIQIGAEIAQEHTESDVDLVIEDTGATVEDARSVTSDMIDDGIPAIMGTISSDVALSLREMMEEEETLHLTPMAGAPDITQSGTNYTFRYPAAELEQAALGILAYFRQEGVSEAAVIGADYSYPRTLVDLLEQHASDVSISQVSYVPLGTDNFQPELEGLEDVDALFLPYPGANGVVLIQQIHERELFEDKIVLGDYSYGIYAYPETLEGQADGLDHWGVDFSTSVAQEVNQAIRSEHDSNADVYHVIGYDAARSLMEAIDQVDEPDPATLQEEYRSIEYTGATGIATGFNENGLNEQFQFMVNRWSSSGEDFTSDTIFKSDPIDV